MAPSTTSTGRTAATETALVVLAPDLDPLVEPWRRRLDPSAGWGMPAHVTLLYPFVAPADLVDAVIARVAAVVAGHAASTVRFASTRWFGDQVVWLAPEPDDELQRLSADLWAAFPDHPPYGGAIEQPRPHLTLADGADVAAMRAAERAVHDRLPVTVEVASVAVMVGAPAADAWHRVAELPLATGRS